MASRIVEESQPDFIFCIGDDNTDEDMFKALGENAYTVKVSNSPTAAQYTILSQQKVLSLLNRLMLPLTEKQYAGS